MSSVRRPVGRIVTALITSVVVGAGGAASATAPTPATNGTEAGPYSGELTFDWPIDCPVTVTQRYERGELSQLDAEFTVELSEGGAPGNLLVSFGPALVTAVAGHSSIQLDEPTTSHSWTNPTVEIDPSGALVAIGLEEWEEADAGATDPGDDALGAVTMMPTDFRVITATWPAWVGAWAHLGTIDGVAETEVVVGSEASPRAWSLTAIAEQRADGLVELYGSTPVGESGAHFDLTAVVDPLTLQPHTARFDYFVTPRDISTEAFDWTFDWSACEGATTVGELPPATTAAPATTSTTTPAITAVTVPGFRSIHVDDLPLAALDTLDLIAAGGPFPYRQDDSVFQNREGLLPRQPSGYYREYTVETPGLSHRGARRIVAGDGGELFYTDDHYDSFRVIVF